MIVIKMDRGDADIVERTWMKAVWKISVRKLCRRIMSVLVPGVVPGMITSKQKRGERNGVDSFWLQSGV